MDMYECENLFGNRLFYPRVLLHCSLILLIVLFLAIPGNNAFAGPYIVSAHGQFVDRADAKLDGYSPGNCAHCHEQHMSIDGGEPAPVGGVKPSSFILFSDNHTNQTDNFCYKCHVDSGSVQQGGSLINRSYSYRAGNWSADALNDILEAFTLGGPTTIRTSHDLDNVLTFVTDLVTHPDWGYSTNSNPCTACHNPHSAQGDPENSPNAAKSSTPALRGYPLARSSQHNDVVWDIWGNDAGEKMIDYSALYQAPYRFPIVPGIFEPDGSAIINGSNLTDINTFCLDCHQYQVPSSSTVSLDPDTPALKLSAIAWGNEKHGGITTEVGNTRNTLAPYVVNQNYVMSCLDCHESHGSRNDFLLRPEVNGVVLSGSIVGGDLQPASLYSDMSLLCINCHQDDGLVPSTVVTMHANSGATPAPGVLDNCETCHYHGSMWPDKITPDRTTF